MSQDAESEPTTLTEVVARARGLLDGTGLESLTDQEIVSFLTGLSDEPDVDGTDAGMSIRVIAEARASDQVTSWQRTQAAEVEQHRMAMAAFEHRLANGPWHVALEALDAMYLRASSSCEAHYLGHYRDTADTDFRWDTLVRLHRRALMVAGEVRVLLRSGFPVGAHARWRALQEIALLSFLVLDADGLLAERYLLHQGIEAAQGLRLILEYADRFPGEVPSRTEQEAILSRERLLLARFGKPYGNRYGWAAQHLGVRNPSLKDIAARVDMGHWRPSIGLADHSVHAGSRSMHWDIGQPEEGLPRVGATNYGLDEAGQSTAVSLGAAAAAFLVYRPDVQSLGAASALHLLATDVQQRFLTSARALQRAIERDELESMRAVRRRRPLKGSALRPRVRSPRGRRPT